MQAIVQAAATALVVGCRHVRANSTLVMALLPVVPLLTSRAYSLLVEQLFTGEVIGTAAVAMSSWRLR
jgi:hypothetical protein